MTQVIMLSNQLPNVAKVKLMDLAVAARYPSTPVPPLDGIGAVIDERLEKILAQLLKGYGTAVVQDGGAEITFESQEVYTAWLLTL